jgi:HD superfamily phosphohydrolase YqeK
LNAISEHTLGAAAMTKLSKVVFLADCLEPNRPANYTQPIWQALNGKSKQNYPACSDKQFDLDLGILVACDVGLQDLLESGRAIHPKTVEVRNYYLKLIQNRNNR